LHTLKGNSAIFGLESVADLCHQLESDIGEDGQLPPLAGRRALAERWASLALQLERLLGARRDVIEVDPADHRTLEREIRRGIPRAALLRRFHELKLDPTQRRLDGFGAQAKTMAQRLQKGAIEVVAEGNGLRVDAKHWGPFWSGFVHALRNSVDHGLETPEERVAAGKRAEGRLVLKTYVADSLFVVEIQDDGRGIDWDRLQERAARLGVTWTAREELLFVDGLSTTECVTDISGRGVGLGALRDSVTQLGGTLEVETQLGQGTTFRMLFPETATMPGLRSDTPMSTAA
jgi:two-component system chemotaxis sensor kinase CheA